MTNYKNILDLWQGFNIKTEADLELRLESFKILFAFNSNKIENVNTTYDDTYEIFDKGRVSNYTGDVTTLVEIQNQRSAYERMIKAWADKEPLTERLVLEFHQILTEGTYDERRVKLGEKPGEYKHNHYVVGIDEVGAAPETVAQEIIELLEEITTTAIAPNNVLNAASYFHAKFENIHPFADGNGRCGRLLLNYFLISHDYPPVNIFDEDRVKYYEDLHAFHESQDIEPLRIFIEQETVKTWEKTLERSKPSRSKEQER